MSKLTGITPLAETAHGRVAPPTHEVSANSGQRVDPVATQPAPTESTAVSPDTVSETPIPDDSTLGLRRGDQLFIGVLMTVALVLLGIHWVRLSRWGTEPVEIDRQASRWYDYRVDINTATWVEWAQLEGIGETLSQRIVADREANGPFSSIDDLQRVKGIGPKTIARLRPWLRIGPPLDEPPDLTNSSRDHITH